MASTTYVDLVGPTVNAAWLNDVNALEYNKTFSDATHAQTTEALMGPSGSSLVGFIQSGTGAVAMTVQDKNRETMSAHDFGALGDGTGRLPSADGIVTTSASWNAWPSWITGATYGTKPGHDYGDATYLANNKPFTNADTWDFIGITLAMWAVQSAGGGTVFLPGTTYVVNRPIRFVMGATGTGVDLVGRHRFLTKIQPLTTPASIAGIGAPAVYMYHIGLSGCAIRNMAITTYPLNGGAPTPQFDPTVVGPNWQTAATYTACVIMNQCDTVVLDSMFMSGYGEAGLVGLNTNSYEAKNIITEYYTIAILNRGNSNCWIEDSVIFSSSGTGVNSWKTTGIYLNTSAAYVSGGQFSLMRYASVYADGSANNLTFQNVINITNGYGGLFQCQGMDSWLIQGCTFKFGQPNTTPIVLLDGIGGGVRPLSATFAGGQFSNNNITNSGTYAYDLMWVTGTGIQIINNYIGAIATGANTAGLVVDSLLNNSYSGPGTVNCQFSGNILTNFAMSQVSVFGQKYGNIDNAYLPFSFVSASPYTVGGTELAIQSNMATTLTLTMPPPANYNGREITVTTLQGAAVVSAVANISPIGGGADVTAILPATSGKWARLISNGSSWRVISSN